MNRAWRRAAARAQRAEAKAQPRRGRPRQMLANPLEHVLTAVRPLTDEQQQTLSMRTHAAMTALTQGTGSDQDAATLGAMTNVTLVLVERVTRQAGKKGDETQIRVAGEALAIVKHAQAALIGLQQRAAERGAWGFAGPELLAVNECIELHDSFVEMAPQGLIEQAAAEAQARARRGLVAANVDELEQAA